MRRLTLILSLAAALGVFLTGRDALASEGLPLLCELQAGPYGIALHNDSPSLVIGRNVLTLEVPAEAASREVRLSLLGPNGETLTVPLRPVTVLGGTGGDSEMEGMPGMEDMPGMSAPAPTLLRGTAELPKAGQWRAQVTVSDLLGNVDSAERELSAVDGGPNRLYLWVMATVIGGALVFGVVAPHGAKPVKTGRAR